MSDVQTRHASSYITPITCACGGKAHLIRRFPVKDTDTECRVFDCVNCRELLEIVVEAAR